MKIRKKKKVIIAMSGGVDSSVAAALLKRAHFDVVGVFMKFWPEKKARERARRVAEILKIPFFVCDLSKDFKKKVVDHFLEGYKRGLTPNPCVICNKEIKFRVLLKKLLEYKADFVATGHYAKIKKDKKEFCLLRAKDKNKDQSYFLWMLNQEQLKKILFPIGNLTRKEVEKLAKNFNLPVLKTRKSVELCFVQGKLNDFLKRYLKERPGKIVDTQGKILGEHRGLWFYTIGQRKGIFLSGGPYYVLEKNIKKNLLIITKKEKDLYKKELIASNVNWIASREPKLPLKVTAKIRYRQEPAVAKIFKLKNKNYKLIFEKPQRAITPGQSVVFYKKDKLLGGGIIN